MKQILKYLFFILFGIILYHILDNTINKFNIGIPPKRRPWVRRTCASDVSAEQDVNSNSDDSGYDTANSYEPQTVGYLFQGYPAGITPIPQWYFTTDIPPYENVMDLQGNLLNLYPTTYQISPAPNDDIIQTTTFFDPNIVYTGMNDSFKDLFGIISSIYNLSSTG